jgi:hypothetical protein
MMHVLKGSGEGKCAEGYRDCSFDPSQAHFMIDFTSKPNSGLRVQLTLELPLQLNLKGVESHGRTGGSQGSKKGREGEGVPIVERNSNRISRVDDEI